MREAIHDGVQVPHFAGGLAAQDPRRHDGCDRCADHVTPTPPVSPGCGLQLVFDASQKGPDLWFAGFGLVFVVIGAGLLAGRSVPRIALRLAPVPRVFPVIFLCFAVLWTTLATVGILGSWYSTQAEIRKGAPVVEGAVENFHPMPVTGHDQEHFTVQGVYFAYSDYSVTSGFNNTSSHGGPIREGLYVRIHYTGSVTRGTIVKLEIRDCR